MYLSVCVCVCVCLFVPVGGGCWLTNDGGLGAMRGVWLIPFSAGSGLASALGSEGASPPPSTWE